MLENTESQEMYLTTIYALQKKNGMVRSVDVADERGYCSGITNITIPDGVTSIGYRAFYNCSGLTKIYYKGSESEWGTISIDFYNEKLKNATRYYYSAEKPTASGNYWHYNENGEIEEW